MDAKKVISAADMFCYCKNLSKLKLPTFSEKLKEINDYGVFINVHNALVAHGMFEKCYKLTNIDLAPLNTSNVTDMSYMFSDCSGLTSLDLSPLDTQKVTNMSGMFEGCRGLTSLDLSPLDTQKVTDMSYMFVGCSALISLTTDTNFKFVGTDYHLPGTWQNTAGETFTSGKFPSNVADTYTKVSS